MREGAFRQARGGSVIVECAGCRTRFRLADDKIRSTGTKVRCSRCGATFVVRSEEEALLPALDEPSFHDMHTQVVKIPEDVLAQMREQDEQDEQQTQVHTVPAAILAEMRREAAAADGWDLETPGAGRSWEPDPLAPTPTPTWNTDKDPPPSFGDSYTDVTFGPAAEAMPPQRRAVPLPATLPEEDDPLAFLGSAPELPPPDFGGASRDRFAAAPLPELSPRPFGDASRDRFAADPLSHALPPPAFAAGSGPPPLPPPLPGPAFSPPAPPPPVQPVVALPPEPELELELATEGWQPQPPPAEAQRPPPGKVEPIAATTSAPPDPGPAQPVVIGAVPRVKPAPPAARSSLPGRLLGLASGIAVIGTALACFVVARNGGALRLDLPAVLGAVGLGEATAAAGALVPEQLHSGRYPSAAGELFYVRGVISSQADAALGPAIRVVAELLDGDRVVARGVAWAGGEPTPEQVHGLQAPEAWDALAESIGAQSSGPIAPGGEAPFFAVLGAAPADLAGLRLRIAAEPSEVPALVRPALVTDDG